LGTFATLGSFLLRERLHHRLSLHVLRERIDARAGQHNDGSRDSDKFRLFHSPYLLRLRLS
jgi:hypothetical protein